MKTIQQIEAMMQEYGNAGNPEAEWKPETIEFFHGLSVVCDREWDVDYPFAFRIRFTFAGVSSSAVYHLGVGMSLCEELNYLAIHVREAIEKRAAKCVRDEIKGILHI